MSKGMSGYFTGTKGSRAAVGSIDYMRSDDSFSRYIKNRKDIDSNGFYDVIAHGTPHSIQIESNGKTIEIDHRFAAKLFKNNPAFKDKSIRLLSCNTGSNPSGFAQNLANKLNVVVEAPTKLVWAWPNGQYLVADRRTDIPDWPDLRKKGRFIKFYPGGKKK